MLHRPRRLDCDDEAIYSGRIPAALATVAIFVVSDLRNAANSSDELPSTSPPVRAMCSLISDVRTAATVTPWSRPKTSFVVPAGAKRPYH